MIVILTFDVEPDCPPFLWSERGLKEGLPRILELLDKHEVPGTFFFTAKWAERYQELVDEIRERHELGCHGYAHERFDKLSLKEAESVIEKAKKVLGDVKSFRAPNLKLPLEYYKILKDNGFLVDSSKALHKGWKGIREVNGVLEVPVYTTSLVTRLPWRIQLRWHKKNNRVKVLMFHPWEFVKMPINHRPDCWFGTGKKALDLLDKIIGFYKSQGAEFLTLVDFYHIYVKNKDLY
ncbi:polysaccharide deacetylase family protein [Pyrococcus abyssi]|uniref:Polysaccharide deacetylase n=1 Tax=Pyrococcus abyssi (strain GE5 / Orsay) TaxID=272844 RepID=G8ZKP8_PYRAB|nr:polysaccharide deacetylase family protein [Pyrococcus abyssi]CCE70691.1 TPA: polysaccharide deacetylase [Pyrococcus abyssi GE5]